MLNPYAVGNPPYGEVSTISATANLNYYAVKYLSMFLFPLPNLGTYPYRVARGKLGNIRVWFVFR
jgi:hypothetical protein